MVGLSSFFASLLDFLTRRESGARFGLVSEGAGLKRCRTRPSRGSPSVVGVQVERWSRRIFCCRFSGTRKGKRSLIIEEKDSRDRTGLRNSSFTFKV